MQLRGPSSRFFCVGAEDGQEAIINEGDLLSDEEMMANAFSSSMTASETVEARGILKSKPVFLNIYHLHSNWERTNQVAGQFLGLGGAFHAGVEIAGTEWTYGCEGVSENEPRRHPENIYAESIRIGETDLSSDDIANIVRKLQDVWRGEDYDMLRHNCCSFSRELCKELVGKPIPAWVDRLAHLASSTGLHQLNGVLDIETMGLNLTREVTDRDTWSEMSSPESSPANREARWMCA
jgi:hypothetical protein